MKHFIRSMPALAICLALGTCSATSFAQFGSGFNERNLVTIRADGTCQLASRSEHSRPMAEQMIRSFEYYEKMQDSQGDEAAPPAQANPPEPKPFSDDELSGKMRALMERGEDGDAETDGRTVQVTVGKDKVTVEATRTFATIEDLLRTGRGALSAGALSFQDARFEIDTNGLLRVTLTPPPALPRHAKNLRARWKLAGASSELKLVFPGKVVSSGFPASQTNATWLAWDATNDASIDAVLKLCAAPIIITAESGGLKIAEPLEMAKAWRGEGGSGVGNDLPLTEAGPGFLAEAQELTLTVIHVFPEGMAYFESNSRWSAQPTGAVVSAKLFAPKGRTLKTVSDVRVLKAVDDKGREISALQDEGEQPSYTAYSGGSEDSASTSFQLRLALPQPDAAAIDEIRAEAVAVTAGNWTEMVLTNLQENATNEVDLSAVLPGARMTITKYSSKERRSSLQARIKGPRSVAHLELGFKLRSGNSDQFHGQSYDRNFSQNDGVATRSVSVEGFGFGLDEADAAGDSGALMNLVIRYPQDLKRERVVFTLKGLDLL